MEKRPIRNLTSLNREIRSLETDVQRKGAQLEKNMEYLQAHYGRMAMNSVFSGATRDHDSVKSKIFSAVWENEVVQKGVDQVVSHMAEGVGSLIDQLLSKLRSKKTE